MQLPFYWFVDSTIYMPPSSDPKYLSFSFHTMQQCVFLCVCIQLKVYFFKLQRKKSLSFDFSLANNIKTIPVSGTWCKKTQHVMTAK